MIHLCGPHLGDVKYPHCDVNPERNKVKHVLLVAEDKPFLHELSKSTNVLVIQDGCDSTAKAIEAMLKQISFESPRPTSVVLNLHDHSSMRRRYLTRNMITRLKKSKLYVKKMARHKTNTK